jgi:hypothetical protein
MRPINYQREESVPEPKQPRVQDVAATEDSDPATEDDDEKRET